ncbi:hypothetical protein GCM10027444_33850 [Actinopolyspora lacussalsi]
MLSAPDAPRLAAYAVRIAETLEQRADLSLSRVAHTLRVGRDHFAERLALLAGNRDRAVRLLRSLGTGDTAGGPGTGSESGAMFRGEVTGTAPVVSADASLAELAECWVAGGFDTWDELEHRFHPGDRTGPGRVPLPGFPYSGEPHAPAVPEPDESDPVRLPRTRTSEETAVDSNPVADSPSRKKAEFRRPVRGDFRQVELGPLRAEERTHPPNTAPKSTAAASEEPTVPERTAAEETNGVLPEPAEPACAGSARAEPGEPTPEVQRTIRRRGAEVLGMRIEDIEVTRSFAELGLDSVFRMELARLLGADFGVELSAAELYEYDTVAKLTRYVGSTSDAGESRPVPPEELSTRPLLSEPAGPETPEPAGPVNDESPPSPVGEPATADAERATRSFVERVLERVVEPGTEFTAAGLTSFDMLRVVSELEKRLGRQPKTLLFDHPTLERLTEYLVETHGAEAVVSLSSPAESSPAESSSAEQPSGSDRPEGRAAECEDTVVPGADEPLVVRKREVPDDPQLRRSMERAEATWGMEGGLAGRDIAPLAFVGAERDCWFNISRSGETLFAWSYVGSERNFLPLAEQYLRYARRHGLRANFLSRMPVDELGGQPLLCTPFGAVQRLPELADFSLRGGRMSRLRYMVRRFAKAGSVETAEYRCGDDPETDRAIAELMDRWTENKQMVNPYVAVVREEILSGSLDERHRVFLTHLDGRLVTAVIITRIPSENGYLLDLEFYPPDMPLGGLEFTVVEIIETLVAEGSTTFSFGASFGVRLDNTPNEDPEIVRGLDELESVGIFGAGNFQFKNKFRPTNLPLYLCQPDVPDRSDVSDVIMMIAEPRIGAEAPELYVPASTAHSASDTGGTEPVEPTSTTASASGEGIDAYSYNPLLVPHHEVPLDLVTDSWAELETPAVVRAVRRLRESVTGEPEPADLARDVGWLPFESVVPVPSGRAAEALLCHCWPSGPGEVPHNGVFPSWNGSLLDAGFKPVRMDSTTPDDRTLFRDIDIDALERSLAERGERISFVCLEPNANSNGGHPLSMAGLRAVSALTARYRVPLVLDATRALDNALLITEYEPEYHGTEPFRVLREMLGFADAVTMSLSKDFELEFGGLLASSRADLVERMEHHIAVRGPQVGLAARKMIAASLADEENLLPAVAERSAAVELLHTELAAAGIPVLSSGAGHCVLLDLSRLSWCDDLGTPVATFLALLYERLGVRAAPHPGAAESGRDELVRLAVPLGTDFEAIRALAPRLASLLADPGGVRELVPLRPGDTGPLAEYRPADGVPDDVRSALREGHRPLDENLTVVREHGSGVRDETIGLLGGSVEMIEAGSPTAPPLLLMHPFNIGAGLFAPQYAALEAGYRTICLHHPGVGNTTAAPDDLSLDGLAELWRHALAERGIRGPYHVLGASFGGLVAQTFALHNPSVTASLTLLGSSYRVGNRVGEVNRLSAVAGEDFDRLVEVLPPGSPPVRRREELESLLLRCESMDSQLGLRYLDVFADNPDLLARLPHISVPTLIVHGSHDTVIPLKTAHLLHGVIPDAEWAEIHDAGHFPGLTSPESVHEALVPFLAEHTPGEMRAA